MSLRFRGYDPRDAGAVAQLDEWAMRAAGTDPADIPGHGDIQRIGSAYLDAGGEFLVGVLDSADPAVFDGADHDRATIETFDGLLAAMGGFLPNADGYDDERTVAGAAELHRMRVAPPLQGRGYGTDLLRALERRATGAGFSRVLATTARRQERALALYSGAGYERVDTSTYGEYDLVHFEKTPE
jgi:GNAT superfamily N-acetyltransferase